MSVIQPRIVVVGNAVRNELYRRKLGQLHAADGRFARKRDLRERRLPALKVGKTVGESGCEQPQLSLRPAAEFAFLRSGRHRRLKRYLSRRGQLPDGNAVLNFDPLKLKAQPAAAGEFARQADIHDPVGNIGIGAVIVADRKSPDHAERRCFNIYCVGIVACKATEVNGDHLGVMLARVALDRVDDKLPALADSGVNGIQISKPLSFYHPYHNNFSGARRYPSPHGAPHRAR